LHKRVKTDAFGRVTEVIEGRPDVEPAVGYKTCSGPVQPTDFDYPGPDVAGGDTQEIPLQIDGVLLLAGYGCQLFDMSTGAQIFADPHASTCLLWPR